MRSCGKIWITLTKSFSLRSFLWYDLHTCHGFPMICGIGTSTDPLHGDQNKPDHFHETDSVFCVSVWQCRQETESEGCVSAWRWQETELERGVATLAGDRIRGLRVGEVLAGD